MYGSWTDCTAECGGGVQSRNVSCARSVDFEPVSDDLCDPQVKPATNRTCSADPCNPEWYRLRLSTLKRSCLFARHSMKSIPEPNLT